jgi:hypothetical protein
MDAAPPSRPPTLPTSFVYGVPVFSGPQASNISLVRTSPLGTDTHVYTDATVGHIRCQWTHRAFEKTVLTKTPVGNQLETTAASHSPTSPRSYWTMFPPGATHSFHALPTDADGRLVTVDYFENELGTQGLIDSINNSEILPLRGMKTRLQFHTSDIGTHAGSNSQGPILQDVLKLEETSDGIKEEDRDMFATSSDVPVKEEPQD